MLQNERITMPDKATDQEIIKDLNQKLEKAKVALMTYMNENIRLRRAVQYYLTKGCETKVQSNEEWLH